MDNKESGVCWIEKSHGIPWCPSIAAFKDNRIVGEPVGGQESGKCFAETRELSGLFLHLAESPAHEDGIAAFFDRVRQQISATRSGVHSITLDHGLAEWIAAATWMAVLVDLWRRVQTKDHKGLRQHVRWQTDQGNRRAVVYDCQREDFPEANLPAGGVREVIATDLDHGDWLATLKGNDVVAPSLAFLARKITQFIGTEVAARLLLEMSQKRLRVEVVPTTFFAFLWLQFGRAIADDKEFVRCRTCQTWFERSTETARTNRRFCSNACRTKNYRRRRAEARRLHVAGVPVRQIAKQLDADVAAVRTWIRKQHG
jgi:hypothetical protein